jgi:hypothetical protein
MPYIRLYSRELPLDEKRLIAQELTAIALSAFQLRREERDKITVQFLPLRQALATWGAETAEVVVDVSDHTFNAGRISDFIGAATTMLVQSAAVKPAGRIARWLRMATDPARQIAFRFNDTSALDNYVGGDHFAALARRAA